MGQNFHETISKQAIELKLLARPIHITSFACYNLVAQPVGYGYYGFGDIALQVARAAEESRPREAIELYRQRAERLIAQRGRQNYQQACTFLAKMSVLYKQLGEHDTWTSYLTGLREQNRNLRALKEEMADANL